MAPTLYGTQTRVFPLTVVFAGLSVFDTYPYRVAQEMIKSLPVTGSLYAILYANVFCKLKI